MARTQQAATLPFNTNDQYQPNSMISYNFFNLFTASLMFIRNVVANCVFMSVVYFFALTAVGLILLAIKNYTDQKVSPHCSCASSDDFSSIMIGTDGVSYAILILFVSYLLYLYAQKTPITRRQWLMMHICAAIVWAKPLLYLFLFTFCPSHQKAPRS